MKYTVKIEEQTFQVEIEDLHVRPIIAIVDGEKFEIWPENGDSAPAKATPPTSHHPQLSETIPSAQSIPKPVAGAGSSSPNTVRAPIPGVIVNILVKSGDQVTHGQELLIIEAMKMKNTIRSSRNGLVAEIHVAPGQTVVHNEILVTFTE